MSSATRASEISSPSSPSSPAGHARDGLRVGHYVILHPEHEEEYSLHKAGSEGPLKEGVVGRVVEIDMDPEDEEPFKVLVPSGESWWYEEGQLERVKRPKRKLKKVRAPS